MKKSGQDNEDVISIVLVGKGFPITDMGINKLLENDIISEDDFKSATIHLQTPEQSVFSIEPYVIEIDSNRVIIKLTDISKKFPARDIITNIINKYDLYKKIEKIGFNFHRRLFCLDENEWNRIGHKLMPKDFWANDIFPDSKQEDFGLLKYEMQSNIKYEEKEGHIVYRVSPLKDFGIEVTINDHISVPEENRDEQISNIFNGYFEASFNRSFSTLITFEEKI